MTVSGTRTVDGTTVTGGATLTLEPGATLKFRPNKRLIIEDGAGILAEGTSGSTIRFKRNNSSEPWDGVEVRGQGQPRVFEHVVFQGSNGSSALEVKAQNAEVSHAHFADDDAGNAITVRQTPSGGTGTLTLSNSTMRKNVVVKDGAHLAVEGDALSFGGGAELIIEEGAGFTIESGPGDKMRFKPVDPSSAWGGVTVHKRGRYVFEHVAFNGSSGPGLRTKIDSVVVRNASFGWNTKGLYLGRAPSGALSSADVQNATFESNSQGMRVSRHAEARVSGSSFLGNGVGVGAVGEPHACGLKEGAASGGSGASHRTSSAPPVARTCFDLVKITGSTFEDNLMGVDADNRNLRISGSTFERHTFTGIEAGGRVRVTNSTINDGSRDGLWLEEARSAVLRQNIVENNGYFGVNIIDSDVRAFEDNFIDNNGAEGLPGPGTQGGIYLGGTSSLYMNGDGRNSVRYNEGPEITVRSSDARLYLGDSSYAAGGHNDIFDNFGGTDNHYVHNGSSQSVKAEGNYWGDSNISPSESNEMFGGTGGVDYVPYSPDPFIVDRPLSASIECGRVGISDDFECAVTAQGGGGVQQYNWIKPMDQSVQCSGTPAEGGNVCTIPCETDVEVDVLGTDGSSATVTTTTGACYEGGPTAPTRQTRAEAGGAFRSPDTPQPFSGVDRTALQGRITALVQSLRGPGSGADTDAHAVLHELYGLLLLDAKVEQVREGRATAVFGGWRNRTRGLFTGGIQRVVRWGPAGAPGDYADWSEARLAKQRAGEAAILVEVENLLRARVAPDEVLAQAGSYAPHLAYTRSQAELLLLKATAHERAGDYAEALWAVEAAEAAGGGLGAYTPPNLTPIKRHLQRLLNGGAGGARTAGTEQGASSGPKATRGEGTGAAASLTGLPTSFALGAPYPNPSRERVTLPMALPEQATVRAEVYDVLGRRVHELTGQRFPAGRPELSVPVRRLSSGMYLVRVHIEAASGESRVFTEQVTVVR